MRADNPRMRRSREVHPHRKGLCRWCSGPVVAPRRSWCSDKCVQEYMDQDPKRLRRLVKERDHEVCAACGRDCRAIRLRLEQRLLLATNGTAPERLRAVRWSNLLRRLRLQGRWSFEARSLWEADHIVPVVEDGANELSNLRTLCLPCHKAETRALAKRRAEARRAERKTA